MKPLILSFGALLFLIAPAAFGQGETDPIRPGVRNAEKLANPADVPPRAVPRLQERSTDPATLKSEAEELAKLPQAIPAKIDRLAQGRIPQDLDAQLKQIEKLARRLRREIGW